MDDKDFRDNGMLLAFLGLLYQGNRPLEAAKRAYEAAGFLLEARNPAPPAPPKVEEPPPVRWLEKCPQCDGLTVERLGETHCPACKLAWRTPPK